MVMSQFRGIFEVLMIYNRFQWVICQLDELRKCIKPSQIRNALATLPRTLSGTYDRILADVDERSWEDVRKILMLMAYSYATLLIEEVAEAVAIDIEGSHFHLEDRFLETSSVMTICPGLITTGYADNVYTHGTRQKYVRFVHSSIKGYLTAGTTRAGRAAEIPLEAEAHARIAEMCLIYLLDLPQFGKRVRPHYINHQFPFAIYAWSNWTYHARMAAPASDRLEKKALALLQPQNVPEVFNLNIRSGLAKSKINPLFDASNAGLTLVVEQLLVQGAGVHKPDIYADALSAALCAASLWGHLAILQLLLDHGASVNFEKPAESTP